MSDSDFDGYSRRDTLAAERVANGEFRHDAEDRGEDGIVLVHICPGCGDEFPADLLDEASFCANCHDYSQVDSQCLDCGDEFKASEMTEEGLCIYCSGEVMQEHYDEDFNQDQDDDRE